MSSSSARPLWDFSLEVYGRPKVAETCLRLQDEFGVDVPVLLFAAWLAAEHSATLGRADVAQVVAPAVEGRPGPGTVTNDGRHADRAEGG